MPPPADYQALLEDNALDVLFFEVAKRIFLERIHDCAHHDDREAQ